MDLTGGGRDMDLTGGGRGMDLKEESRDMGHGSEGSGDINLKDHGVMRGDSSVKGLTVEVPV